MAKDVFRKSSLEDISTPDEMGDYIKVTNPGIWTMLVACLAIAVAAVVWSIVGRIPDTVSAQGVIFPSGGTVTVVSTGNGQIRFPKTYVPMQKKQRALWEVLPTTS